MTTSSDPLVLLAPLQGWAAPIEETPDPVFAQKMLGEGVAIDPTLGELRAPCAGTVLDVHASAHAVALRAANGAEILLHIGLETVGLCGDGFECQVRGGQDVEAGDLLIRFDLDLVARKARSLVSPMVITNGAAFVLENVVTGREVRWGERVATVRPVFAGAAAATAQSGEALVRAARVALEHGLHARPAALLAGVAKRFAAELSVAVGERRANARSPVSVMALGVRQGDEVIFTGKGADAGEALDALAAFVSQATVEASPPEPAAPTVAPSPVPSGSPLSHLGGVAAAPGLAIGAAVRLVEPEVMVNEVAGALEVELAALAVALEAVRQALTTRLTGGAGQGREIVEAHLAFVDDPELGETAQAAVRGGSSAGVAWRGAIGEYVRRLRGLGDARMMERAADLADLERQVLLELAGEAATPLSLPSNAIILADDILPSQLMALDAARIAGLAVSRGGPTSHVAILAAAMSIPAVVALGPRVLSIEDGALLILDGDAGRLQVAPGPADIEAAQARLAERRSRRATAQAAAHQPCHMADGTRIEVFANLGAPGEGAAAVANGAEGCGLLRTEFLFLDRREAPGEAEQHAAYQAIADELGGRPLIIRTLDVGGDKPAPYLPFPSEDNPALGVRGVRVSLARPDLLRAQLRAILGVRPAGRARIMAPMIASLSELRAVRRILAELAADMGVEPPPLGVMVETPAAAVTADLLAAEAEFLSIGTNDLAQYALAMDRGNAQLAAQVDGAHPAVLRLIQQACAGGAKHGRMVAVCGGLASDLATAPILIGLGVTELSAAPSGIAELKARVRELTLAQCRDLAERALRQTSAAEVRALNLGGATPIAAAAETA